MVRGAAPAAARCARGVAMDALAVSAVANSRRMRTMTKSTTGRLAALAALIALSASADDPAPVVRLETSAGNIDIELFPTESPRTVENFLRLVDERFYDGLIFHRVIADFMIQAGATMQP